jgi:CubicO group peptidase (beta-lactamase class C family)
MRPLTWFHRLVAVLSLALVAAAQVPSSTEARPGAPAPDARAFDPAASRRELARQIDGYLAQHQAVGQLSGAVLVADRGELIYQGGFGMADSDWAILNTPSTKFRLASLTKQFTALIVLQLVREGRLDLESSITRYLADYPAASGERVTLRHLLNHTSGIPSYTDRPGFMTSAAKERYSTKEFVALFCSEPLEFEPGSRFQYNNSGYFLLGAIIEAVTGKTYGAALQERIFGPLEMTNSGLDDQYQVLPGRATGYSEVLGGRRVALWIDMTSPGAAGAMYSTVEDLWKWDQALLAETLLDGDLARLMVTPGHGNYAMGWEIETLPPESGGSVLADLGAKAQGTESPESADGEAPADQAPGRTAHTHSGGMPGVSTLIWRVPAEGRCIIVLGNTFETAARPIQHGISEILAGRQPRPVRARGDFEIARMVLTDGRERALEALAKWPENIRNDLLRPDVIGIGHQLVEQGRCSEAVTLGAFLKAAFPTDPEVCVALASFEHSAGNLQAALEAYRQIPQLDAQAEDIQARISEVEAQLQARLGPASTQR